MEDISILLINNMKKHRARLGMSQFKLAEDIGVSEDTITRIETGRQFPGQVTLTKLIAYFNIKPYQLFVGEEEPFDKDKFVDIVYPQITKEIHKILQKSTSGSK